VRTAQTSGDARRTGNPPLRLIQNASGRERKSSSLPICHDRRGSAATATTSASMKATWLQTMSTGPSGGMRSRPSRRRRRPT